MIGSLEHGNPDPGLRGVCFAGPDATAGCLAAGNDRQPLPAAIRLVAFHVPRSRGEGREGGEGGFFLSCGV